MMWKQIRNIGLLRGIARRSFRKVLSKHQDSNKSPTDIEPVYVQKVGILFNGDKLEQLNATLTFGEYLEKKRIKVHYLSYLPKVKYPELLKTDVYSDDKIKWNGVPTGLSVDKFIASTFDLLITTTVSGDWHYEYIMAASKAKIKVGSIHSIKEVLDVIIDVEDPNDYKQYFLKTENVLNSICPITH